MSKNTRSPRAVALKRAALARAKAANGRIESGKVVPQVLPIIGFEPDSDDALMITEGITFVNLANAINFYTSQGGKPTVQDKRLVSAVDEFTWSEGTEAEKLALFAASRVAVKAALKISGSLARKGFADVVASLAESSGKTVAEVLDDL